MVVQTEKKSVFCINFVLFRVVDHSIVRWLLVFLVLFSSVGFFLFAISYTTQIYFPPYFGAIAELHSTCVAVNSFSLMPKRSLNSLLILVLLVQLSYFCVGSFFCCIYLRISFFEKFFCCYCSWCCCLVHSFSFRIFCSLSFLL